MTINHTFLKDLDSDAARRDAIAKLPEWRKSQIISRIFPGVSVGDLDYDDAIQRDGVSAAVTEQPLFHSPSGVPIRNHKAIVHPNFSEPAGIVGGKYGLVQHTEALAGLKSLVDDGSATLENLHVSENGGRLDATGLIGFSAFTQLGRDKADTLGHFARVRNSHDGSGSVSIGLFTARLICLNGMVSLDARHRVSVRHTKNAVDYVRHANDGLLNVIGIAKEEVDLFAELAQVPMKSVEFKSFATELIESTRGSAKTERARAGRAREVLKLDHLFRAGDGNFGASKYDALNAVTQDQRLLRDEANSGAAFANKFKSNEEGNGAKVRRKALELLAA